MTFYELNRKYICNYFLCVVLMAFRERGREGGREGEKRESSAIITQSMKLLTVGTHGCHGAKSSAFCVLCLNIYLLYFPVFAKCFLYIFLGFLLVFVGGQLQILCGWN
jgi:hypothetical protein